MSLSPSDLQRLDEIASLVVRARAAGVTGALYAHCKLQTTERQTHILFGAVPLLGHEVAVLDWQNAPLAEAFFAHGPGEAYEVEVGSRIVTGRMLEKDVLLFRAGELHRVEWDGGAAERVAGTWQQASASRPKIPARDESLRKPFRSPLEVELDPAQRRIVELPRERSVLVLGEAGFGKTTVALHRLAALIEASAGGLRAAVMVPTEGLRRLTEVMLERRGIRGVDVLTYESWAAKAARRVFRDLPRRDSTDAKSGVMKLKRHGALEGILQQYVREKPKPAVDPDRPSRYKSRAKRADLLHLFGDSAWMDKVVERSGGDLFPAVVADVVEHTKVQFLKTTEEEFSHVTDKELLVTVDGKTLDDGTPTSDANTVDAEDFAVLFELERLRAVAEGAHATPLGAYDVLLVDEAQEFAPLELALMSRALRPRGIVIVAGDAQQQVNETAHFLGWDAVMVRLRAKEHDKATLEVNYRCPPDVTAVARGVLDVGGPRAAQAAPVPAAPLHAAPVQAAAGDGSGRVTQTGDTAAAARMQTGKGQLAFDLRARAPVARVDTRGSSITAARLEHPLQLAVHLIDELRRLTGEDPSASITVVTRASEAAKNLARTLSHGVALRLALNGDFEFRAGITITSVPEVKGLEFDYVIIPDADSRTYGSTPDARRALYVGVTRATHRLGLVASGNPSPLLSVDFG